MISYFIFFPGNDQILIFASSVQLYVLQTAVELLVDGTFKVVPEIFYQLFIIHAVYGHHVVPVVYVLLRRKNADTYFRLIDKVTKVAPNWLPASIMMKFQRAPISALQNKCPSVFLSGCFFHLWHSMHRKLLVK